MEAKAQMGFSIVMFLFIFFIGNSIAAPQMCNKFIGCTVTINVCKTECSHRYQSGRGICIQNGPPAPPTIFPPPAELQSIKVPKIGKKGCNCLCKFPKKGNQACPK
ncbi:hypothetical protein DH2020_015425 [Rehmannia glutinosa]|uniref:Uncharacterized protein n=1 Tax=Rehmannia glutinosa TaxID=99300 RepID=A0ABR0WSJ9_REHGL